MQGLDKDIPPHGIVGFINSRFTFNPSPQIDQALVQRLIVFTNGSFERASIGFDDFGFKPLHTAKVIEDDRSIRPKRKIPAWGRRGSP